MRGSTQIALAVCLAVLGAAIEARADCQYVRGSIAETRISLDTEPARFLGTVTGVLNGAVTVTLLSGPPNVRSLDIFLTKSGDVLRTEGLPTRTPIPGAPPGEFTYTWTWISLGDGAGTKERTARLNTTDWVTAALSRQPPISFTRGPCAVRTSKATGTERMKL